MKLTAVLACVPALVLYAATDQRDVQFWDVGEMQTVPWIFGIAHPTGFPLFTLLGFAFAHALPVGSVAWRISLFTSVATAATGLAVYGIVAGQTRRAWIALGAALLYETSGVVWSRGTRADVHPLAVAFEAVAAYAFLRWERTRDGRALVWGAAALGAALAVHPVALFLFPGVVVLLAGGARTSLRLRTLGFGALAFALPLLAYVTIPLRSARLYAERRDPTLSLGLDPGAPFWDYAHTAVPANFWWYVTGQQFHRTVGLATYLNPIALLHTFRQAVTFARGELGLGGVLVALIGFVAVARTRPLRALAIALFGAAVIPFAFGYVEEADKQRYLLMTLVTLASAAGLGASALVDACVGFGIAAKQRVYAVVAALVIVAAGAHAYVNRGVAGVNRDALARRYVDQIRARTPSDAIVVAEWVYATPVAYAAYVEHSLGERILVTGTLATVQPHLAAWMPKRCVAVVSGSPRPTPLESRYAAVAINASLPYLFALGNCSAEAATSTAGRARTREPSLR